MDSPIDGAGLRVTAAPCIHFLLLIACTCFSFLFWFLEPTVCGHTGRVCHSKCVVDLWSKTPDFHCAPLEKGQNQLQEIPAISRTVPASTLSDPVFAGIVSLIGKKWAKPHDNDSHVPVTQMRSIKGLTEK